MSTPSSESELREGWATTAAQYVDEHGWAIVPLHPSPSKTSEETVPPVVRQLGRAPLVDLPDDALRTLENVSEWDKIQPPNSPIAILTGSNSGIAALEVGPAAERGLGREQTEALIEALPSTQTVEGPDRKYLLYSYPSGCQDLPQMKRSDGVILHGENSIVRVPVVSKEVPRGYHWDINAPHHVASFPDPLFSFFGIKTGVDDLLTLISNADAAPETASSSSGGNPSLNAGEGRSERRRHQSVPFRTGTELSENDGQPESEIGVPWLANGNLSVLTGAPKTGGKSTFVVNLAAHVAAGTRFLDHQVNPASVVLLSDLPAARFQSLLCRIGVGQEAFERIHVAHPRDVTQAGWHSLLSSTFEQASRVNADLVIIDSLDQYVSAKGGPDPCESDDVVHTLTTASPTSCATLAVKAVSPNLSEGLDHTIQKLGLLGRAADIVAQMDRGPTRMNGTFRRLQIAGRLEAIPTHLLCEMRCGQYHRARPESSSEPQVSGDGSLVRIAGADSDDLPKEPDTYLLGGNGRRLGRSPE